MKAAYIQQFGGPEVLQYGDLPDPPAGPGQIVVDTAFPMPRRHYGSASCVT
jgi:NADPH:quinone reductase-like Zn-dependent oxidoreductase